MERKTIKLAGNFPGSQCISWSRLILNPHDELRGGVTLLELRFNVGLKGVNQVI